MNVCRYCNSTNLVTTPCEPPSPHHARTDCLDCGRFLRWEPAPMTPERAAAFVMPFGKHAGETLVQIGSDPEGRRYLAWLSTQDLKPNLRRVIDGYLTSSRATT